MDRFVRRFAAVALATASVMGLAATTDGLTTPVAAASAYGVAWDDDGWDDDWDGDDGWYVDGVWGGDDDWDDDWDDD